MDQRCRLLVVDDEERVLRALKSIFRRDYDVHACTSASAALKYMSRNFVDVIISDERMPDIPGTELLETVRGRFPNITRILLTASFDRSGLQAAINQGKIFGYIGKPWNLNSMKALVARAATSPSDISPQSVLVTETPVTETPVTETGRVSAAKASFISANNGTNSSSGGGTNVTAGVMVKPHSDNTYLHFAKNKPEEKSTKKPSIILFDRDERVKDQVRKLGAHLKITIYSVNAFEQAVRILALRPDIGVVLFGLPEDAKKTDVALRVMRRYREDLSIIAMANTSSIGHAVSLVNNGRAFRHLHRLSDINGFKRAILSAVRHQQLAQKNRTLTLGNSNSGEADRIFSRSTSLYMATRKRSSQLLPSSGISSGINDGPSTSSVLLVERDEHVRNSVVTISRELGFNVHAASSYVDARATLSARSDISVIVIGVSSCTDKMQCELEVIKRRYGDPCIIAVTDVTHLSGVSQLADAGLVYRYLQTPLDIFEYERTMQAATKHTQMKQRLGALKKHKSQQESVLMLMRQTA